MVVLFSHLGCKRLSACLAGLIAMGLLLVPVKVLPVLEILLAIRFIALGWSLVCVRPPKRFIKIKS